jgi:hypothetical protein
MVPRPFSGDCQDVDGLNGQNTVRPSEKAFTVHFLVEITDGAVNDSYFYDPSYGKRYTGAADFENVAVEGYWIISGSHARVRPLGATTGIVFDDPTTPVVNY